MSLKVYDLTHTFTQFMPEWPSNPSVNIDIDKFHAKDGVYQIQWEGIMHRCTHMDAPIHVTENTPGISDYPLWRLFGTGVCVSIPLGNRQARSNYRIAQLDADQLILNLKALEQDIIVQVDDAVGHVESNLQSVEAAHEATRLAQESLDAEKKKLLAGTSTTFLVLQAQAQLALSRSAEIRARADYAESLVALDQTEGTILRKNNIVLKLDD